MKNIRLIQFILIIFSLLSASIYSQQKFDQGFFESDDSFVERVMNDIEYEIESLENVHITIFTHLLIRVNMKIIPTGFQIDGDIDMNNWRLPEVKMIVHTKESKMILFSKLIDNIFVLNDLRNYREIFIDFDIDEPLYKSLSYKNVNENIMVEFLFKSKSIGLFQFESLRSLKDFNIDYDGIRNILYPIKINQ